MIEEVNERRKKDEVGQESRTERKRRFNHIYSIWKERSAWREGWDDGVEEWLFFVNCEMWWRSDDIFWE